MVPKIAMLIKTFNRPDCLKNLVATIGETSPWLRLYIGDDSFAESAALVFQTVESASVTLCRSLVAQFRSISSFICALVDRVTVLRGSHLVASIYHRPLGGWRRSHERKLTIFEASLRRNNILRPVRRTG